MPPKKTATKSKAGQAKGQPTKESKQEKEKVKGKGKGKGKAKGKEMEEQLPPETGNQAETDAPAPAAEPEPPKEEATTQASASAKSNTSKKRKSPPSPQHHDESEPPKKSRPAPKAPRKGTRTSARTSKPSSNSTPTPTPTQLITYLLSASSLPSAYPADELHPTPPSDPQPQSQSQSQPQPLPQQIYSYALTSPHLFTPFQHLLCASLLSKPLSHTLGLRSIRTLLNAPFHLTTPRAVAEAGEQRVWEALEAARTQHRQKTAAYVFAMGRSMCEEGGWGEDLAPLRDVAEVEGMVAEIKTKVKGMGGTGAEVFLRRVQCCEGWEGVWPFADAKAVQAVRGLGLSEVVDAEGLRTVVERVVGEMDGQMGDMGLEGLGDGVGKEQRLRIAFVVVLERALGASLEGKMDEVRKAALDI